MCEPVTATAAATTAASSIGAGTAAAATAATAATTAASSISAGTVLAALGTAVSAFGAIQQGRAQSANMKYQAQLAEYNAKVAENDATLARQAAEADADTIDRRRRVAIAQNTAQFAAQGITIDEGTTLDVLGNTAAEFELERQNRLHQGELGQRSNFIAAQQQRSNASGLIAQASQAKSAGYTSALGTLAKGAYNISGSLPGSTPNSLPGSTLGSGSQAASSGTFGMNSPTSMGALPPSMYGSSAGRMI